MRTFNNPGWCVDPLRSIIKALALAAREALLASFALPWEHVRIAGDARVRSL
jgi:hypothetical protein